MAEDKKGRGQRNKGGMETGQGDRQGMTGGYERKDVEVVLGRGDWHNWNDIITWLDQSGTQDNQLNPGRINALREDFRKLKNEGEPFTTDPQRVFQMLQQHRGGGSR